MLTLVKHKPLICSAGCPEATCRGQSMDAGIVQRLQGGVGMLITGLEGLGCLPCPHTSGLMEGVSLKGMRRCLCLVNSTGPARATPARHQLAGLSTCC
jgi:hypothetical protein